MDTLTHALSGALLARAGAPREQRPGEPSVTQRVLVGALACGFPDIDFVASFVSPLTYLVNHRGLTHSLVALPLWALLIAWLAARLLRPQRGLRAFAGTAAMGVGLHIAGDLITSFGTILFAPLSDARFAWGTTFIIDLWLSGIIVAGLALSAIWRHSRVPAMAACVALVACVGMQAALKHQAETIGHRHARAEGIAAADATVGALPRALSPFNWTVVVTTRDAQRFAHINLLRKDVPEEPAADDSRFARMQAEFYPADKPKWQRLPRFGNTPEEVRLAHAAWDQPEFAFFRWFADYPALLRTERLGASTCVWFQDLRFANPGVAYTPFRFGMCRDGLDKPWQRFELLGEGRRAPFN
jgi:inner membrane protein